MAGEDRPGYCVPLLVCVRLFAIPQTVSVGLDPWDTSRLPRLIFDSVNDISAALRLSSTHSILLPHPSPTAFSVRQAILNIERKKKKV